jgi:asparagine N-glycosylation enzyme membrane subunit Stt3
MLRTAHKILTGIIIGLGTLHILVTFHDYESFSVEALWFASAGVAIILAGFLNIILFRDLGKDIVVWTLCLITNLVFAVMFVLALMILPQLQVFVGAGLFVALTTFSLINPRKYQRQSTR